MKKNLSAAFEDQNEICLEDLMVDISDACLRASIPIIRQPDNTYLFTKGAYIGTEFVIKVNQDSYTIAVPNDGVMVMTPMTPLQVDAVTNQAFDHNGFIGAIEYILAIHNPSVADLITEVMSKFRIAGGAEPELSAAFFKNDGQLDASRNPDVLMSTIHNLCVHNDIPLFIQDTDKNEYSLIAGDLSGSTFCLKASKEGYSIMTPEGGVGFLTPMTNQQIRNVVGETKDHDQFIGAIEYLLAIHNPAKAETISKFMARLKKPVHTQPTIEKPAP